MLILSNGVRILAFMERMVYTYDISLTSTLQKFQFFGELNNELLTHWFDKIILIV